MASAFNSSTPEAEGGRFLQVQDQPGLHIVMGLPRLERQRRGYLKNQTKLEGKKGRSERNFKAGCHAPLIPVWVAETSRFIEFQASLVYIVSGQPGLSCIQKLNKRILKSAKQYT